jgi:hypothetical protein
MWSERYHRGFIIRWCSTTRIDIQFYKRLPDPVRSSVLPRASKCSDLNHWMLVHHSCYVLLFMSCPNALKMCSEPMYTIPCHAQEHLLNLILYMPLAYTDKLPRHRFGTSFPLWTLSRSSSEGRKMCERSRLVFPAQKGIKKLNSGQSRIRTCNLLLPVLPLINLQNFLRTSLRRSQGNHLLTG